MEEQSLDGTVVFENLVIVGFKSGLKRIADVTVEGFNTIVALGAGPFNFTSSAHVTFGGTSRTYQTAGSFSNVRFEFKIPKKSHEISEDDNGAELQHVRGFNTLQFFSTVTNMKSALFAIIKSSAFEGFNRWMRSAQTNAFINNLKSDVKHWKDVRVDDSLFD